MHGRKNLLILKVKKIILRFDLKITNKGNYDANDVAEVYIEYPDIPRMPLQELKTFKKVFIKKSKEETLHFSIPASELKKWDLQQAGWKLYPGDYYVCIGKNANDMILKKKFTVK